MGRMKELMIEIQEAEAELTKSRWIEDNYGDIEEGTPDWYEAEEAYYAKVITEYSDEPDYPEETLDDSKLPKDPFKEFQDALDNCRTLNRTVTGNKTADESLKIMLYGHIVAATEGFLFFKFINAVIQDSKYSKKLISSDPELGKRKFELKEIHSRYDSLNSEIETYLKDLIFHNVAKVKQMFLSVFAVDLGDVTFLYEAVATRHDCVHRAGLNKSGERLIINNTQIDNLITSCFNFVEAINTEMTALGL